MLVFVLGLFSFIGSICVILDSTQRSQIVMGIQIFVRDLSNIGLRGHDILKLPISGFVEEIKCTKTSLEMTLSESHDKSIWAVGPSLTTGRKWTPKEATLQARSCQLEQAWDWEMLVDVGQRLTITYCHYHTKTWPDNHVYTPCASSTL